MITQFKAIIHSSDGLKTSEKGFRYVPFKVLVPGFTNEFGEKVGKDMIYPITAINDKVDMLANASVGKKIDIKCSIVSDEYQDSKGVTQYGIKFLLHSLTVL